ncbi:hypothetical protein J7T55_004194, partial [Diaporthe amygdali]|uniref:uncharacterized protein n=1 Tax=Phomopsis amygdali TaxID=1214568 RepID=UPI0022FDD3E3
MSRRFRDAATLAVLHSTTSHAFQSPSSLCLSAPPLPLVAGVSNVSAVLDVAFWEQCRAFLCFSDPDFPPITFTFDSSDCVGSETASFIVPDGVPNGDALVIWECEGFSSACTQANITQGKAANSSPLYPHQNGTLNCVYGPTSTQETVLPAFAVPNTPSSSVSDIDSPFASERATADPGITSSQNAASAISASATPDLLAGSTGTSTSGMNSSPTISVDAAPFSTITNLFPIPDLGTSTFILTQTITTLLTKTTTLPVSA